jgi:hypothetical protein
LATVSETIFEEIRSEADLSALVGVADETLYREFKRKVDSRHDRIDDYDRKNFSVALSAFANSDGGVVIWGVGTTRRHNRDVADALQPITNVGAFARRLSDLIKDTVHPMVPGVRLDIVASAGRSGDGYVKCLIPASLGGPHRAFHGDHQYWGRTDAGTYRLEHFQLADMFGRRLRPDLQLDFGLNIQQGGLFGISVDLRNLGRASAKEAGWLVQICDNAQVVHLPPGVKNGTRNSRNTMLDFRFPAQLHPLPLCFGPGPIQFRFIDQTRATIVRVIWYCEDMSYRERDYQINSDGSMEALLKSPG